MGSLCCRHGASEIQGLTYNHRVCACVDLVQFLWKELSKLVFEGCGWGFVGRAVVVLGYSVPRTFLPFFSETQALQMVSSFQLQGILWERRQMTFGEDLADSYGSNSGHPL